MSLSLSLFVLLYLITEPWFEFTMQGRYYDSSMLTISRVLLVCIYVRSLATSGFWGFVGLHVRYSLCTQYRGTKATRIAIS